MKKLLFVTLVAIAFFAAASTRLGAPASSPAGPKAARFRAENEPGRQEPSAGEAVAPISLADSDGQELTVEDLSVRTAVHGMLSLTEIEIRFRNPKSRRIEGRFA